MEPLHALQTKLKQHLPQLDLRVAEIHGQTHHLPGGGPAALLALPKGGGEVRQILQLAHQMGWPPFFLGKGPNLLVADEGVDRFLVKLPGGLTRLGRRGETGLYVGSGVTLAQAATFAAQAGLSGLEFAHGIPGSLGGGVFMNAGAYDGEMAQVIAWVDCLTRPAPPTAWPGDDLALGYRTSCFAQRPWRSPRPASLTPGDPAAIRAKWPTWPSAAGPSSPWSTPAPAPPSSAPPVTLPGASLSNAA